MVGLSASAGVEANWNVDLKQSSKVIPGFDEQMNYTQEKFIEGWKNRIDRHLALFPRVGMATHDQSGDTGWEGGRVLEYTVEQKMATARSINAAEGSSSPLRSSPWSRAATTSRRSSRSSFGRRRGASSSPRSVRLQHNNINKTTRANFYRFLRTSMTAIV